MFSSSFLHRLLSTLHKLYPQADLKISLCYDSEEYENFLEVTVSNGNCVAKVDENGETWIKANGVVDRLAKAVEEVENEEQGRFQAIIEES